MSSLTDLKEDFEELLFLFETNIKILKHELKKIENKLACRGMSRVFLEQEIKNLLKQCELAVNQIKSRDQITDSLDNIESLINLKRENKELLRTTQGIIGSILVATNWQSPSFDHSVYPESGTQNGKIVGSTNDYKRDHHLDAKNFEEQFLKEYVDQIVGLGSHALVTSSGMAAFATVMQFVKSKCDSRPILVGENCYFQNKWDLETAFSNQIIWISEVDNEKILELAEKHQPGAIFIDSLCNTETMPMPNLEVLISNLVKIKFQEKCYLVIDNSLLGPASQIQKHLPILSKNLSLIVVESLNKFYQFGLDRVTGGIIWSPNFDTKQLFTFRMNMGTNIEDASVLSIPPPNRKQLDKRLKRIGRNTLFLVSELDQLLKSSLFLSSSPAGGDPQSFNTKIQSITYPGLPFHPVYNYTKNLTFQGGSFTIVFKPEAKNPRIYQNFLKKIVEECRKNKIPIINGTSFGFDITRIYVTAIHAKNLAQPFIRISPGTETMLEMHRIAEVFKKVMLEF